MKKRNTLKKCLSFICIIVSCISLIACANNPEINTAEKETAKGEQTKENKKDNKRKYEKQESVLEPIIQEAESDPANNEDSLTRFENFKKRQSDHGIEDDDIKLSADMSSVLDTIDRYFQAINDMDADTINEITPSISILEQDKIDSTNIMQRYVDDSAFPLLCSKFKDFPNCFKSFGYDSEDSYNAAIENNQLDDLFKDFHVTYELHAIKKVEDCSYCGYTSGMNMYGDKYNPIEQYENVERWLEEKPANIYMVNLTTVYSYGDKLYGYDKELWNMENPPEEEYNNWILYKKGYNYWIINDYMHFTTDIRVYEYNDKWYIDSPRRNWNLSNYVIGSENFDNDFLVVDYHDPDEEVKKQYYEELESE